MKTQSRKLIVVSAVCLTALLAVVIGVRALSAGGGDAPASHARTERKKALLKHRQKARGTAREEVRRTLDGKVEASKPKEKKKKNAWGDGMFKDMSAADRVVAVSIQEALDNEDYAAVRAQLEKALASPDPELRSHMIDALSWFGAEALPELTAFLGDKDPDIAEEAANNWQIALSDIEDDTLRASTAQAAMTALSNKDALAMLATEITMQDDELKIVQALVDIIEEGTPEAVEVARESYEELTGEKWRGIDSAEAWLQENYEPSEEDESDGKN